MDDHDYGLDNGDKTMPIKDVIRKRFLDFLGEPEDSVRRSREGGICESYFLDPEKKVKLILLDNRYSSEQKNDPGVADDERTALGDVQDKWLREEIMNSTAHFTIIGARIQMIRDDRHQELF